MLGIKDIKEGAYNYNLDAGSCKFDDVVFGVLGFGEGCDSEEEVRI